MEDLILIDKKLRIKEYRNKLTKLGDYDEDTKWFCPPWRLERADVICRDIIRLEKEIESMQSSEKTAYCLP